MSEPTCTESAPCFACARCVRTMANVLRDDPNVRAHMTGVETRPAWKPAWKHAAEAGEPIPSADGGGQWIPDPEKPTHYTFGPLPTESTINLTAAHIATLPTGERVELPAGTVLREGTLPPDAEDDRPTLGEQIHEEHERTR